MQTFIGSIDYSKTSGILFGLITVVVFVYSVVKYHEVGEIEKEINVAENEYDSIPQKLKNPHMNNDQLTRSIEMRRQPILRKLELLKQRRQFILDKIPLIGLFKK